MRNLMRKIHLYLSFVAGPFLLLIAITGIIHVFSEEITYYANKDAIFITPQQESKLQVDTLLRKVEESGFRPVGFLYNDAPDRSFYVLARDKSKNIQLYINPYSGNIIKASGLYDFFLFIEELHTELCMGGSGRQFIGVITFLFFILTVTGIIIWYPKKWSRETAKKSFLLKLKGNTFVINYNLHKILGFYIIIPSIILSVTGVIIAFDPVEIALFNMVKIDGDYEVHVRQIESESLPENVSTISFHQLIQPMINKGDVQVKMPRRNNSRYAVMEVDGNSFFIDRSNGSTSNIDPLTIKSVGVRKVITQLHSGREYGITYKIILFLTALILFSLPITGLVIWYKKLRIKRVGDETRNNRLR